MWPPTRSTLSRNNNNKKVYFILDMLFEKSSNVLHCQEIGVHFAGHTIWSFARQHAILYAVMYGKLPMENPIGHRA